MNEREQIINFLLQSADQKTKIIEELQKQIAELQKKLVSTEPDAKQTL